MKKAKKARIMSASEIERRTAIAMNGGNPFEGMKDWEVTLDLNDPREREIHKYTQKLFDEGMPGMAALYAYVMKTGWRE